MQDQSAWNMYIFRDGRNTKSGIALRDDLLSSLRQLCESSPSQTLLLDTLIRAGELECALADTDPSSITAVEKTTDVLAEALVSGEFGSIPPLPLNAVIDQIERIHVPAVLPVPTPEGFAYYALHPLGYVDLLAEVDVEPGCAAVVGIRCIGTTLSAVVRAGLRSNGILADRITVRPKGHPYSRNTELNSSQKSWVVEQCARGAHFFVVDEGPGMSGSSFLSVGDALLEAGVPQDKITFLCSRIPDPTTLTAPDAAIRWPSFHSLYVAPNRRIPRAAREYAAGGMWREWIFGEDGNWPASWTQMERLKFLSADRSRLFKFDGFGRFGAEVQARARAIGEGGFGLPPIGLEQGFGIYPVIQGEPLRVQDLDREVIAIIAAYCAYRAKAVPAEVSLATDLETMLRFNFREEFGVEVTLRLEVKFPVISDGRMLPHKWLRTPDGRLLKMDNATHGDDHFFPGPTDIAWDLAGAAIEWEMSSQAIRALLSAYKDDSGDDASGRLPAYLLAYSVFRMGYCRMAAEAMAGSPESGRLASEYRRYRNSALQSFERLEGQMPKTPLTSQSQPSSVGVNQWA